MKPIQKIKKALIIGAVALAAALCGFMLITNPSREREQVEEAQAALIQDILEVAEPEPEETHADEFSEPLDFFFGFAES